MAPPRSTQYDLELLKALELAGPAGAKKVSLTTAVGSALHKTKFNAGSLSSPLAFLKENGFTEPAVNALTGVPDKQPFIRLTVRPAWPPRLSLPAHSLRRRRGGPTWPGC